MIKIQAVANQPIEIARTVSLFSEYANELQENLCFQSFDEELANPLKKYAPPQGQILLAYYNNLAVGCVALQPLPQAGVCEMKRLYVQPQYRKYKIGEALVIAILQAAQQIGYTKMKLDTLERLQPAIALYKKHGFAITNAYYTNPLPNVVYMEKEL
jgi:putative acetyltransferase